MATKKTDSINLIEIFKDFKEFKNIDKQIIITFYSGTTPISRGGNAPASVLYPRSRMCMTERWR